MSYIFIFILIILSVTVTLTFNVILGGTFISHLTLYYLILLCLFFLLLRKFLKFSACKSILIAVCVVFFSVVSIRIFSDVVIYEPENFNGFTLLELDLYLWNSTHGRILLSYSPDFRKLALTRGKEPDNKMSLDQLKNYLQVILPISEIKVARRYGYVDFGFRNRGYQFIIKIDREKLMKLEDTPPET